MPGQESKPYLWSSVARIVERNKFLFFVSGHYFVLAHTKVIVIWFHSETTRACLPGMVFMVFQKPYKQVSATK